LSVKTLPRSFALVGAAALIAAGAAGCAAQNHAGGSGIVVVAASVLEPAATCKATVGYLDIRNNGTADQLVSVRTSVGGTVQLRAPVRPGASPIVFHTVPDIPVAANAMTQLVPDSYHLLITGAGPLRDGKDITLTLTFARSGPITILALVTNPESGGSSYFLN
jgi:copper(I)-binding protein